MLLFRKSPAFACSISRARSAFEPSSAQLANSASASFRAYRSFHQIILQCPRKLCPQIKRNAPKQNSFRYLFSRQGRSLIPWSESECYDRSERRHRAKPWPAVLGRQYLSVKWDRRMGSGWSMKLGKLKSPAEIMGTEIFTGGAESIFSEVLCVEEENQILELGFIFDI